MRYFFERTVPHPHRIVLVESGAREVLEALLPKLPEVFGDIEIDVVTCYAGPPKNFTGRVFNINEYGGPSARDRLLSDLLARDYQMLGLLCTGEPIMTKWKWWLLWHVPAKGFIVNENADLFWVDRAHWMLGVKLALDRAGLSGGSAVPALARLALLPFTVTFLLSYAAFVHARRNLRLLLRSPRRV